MEVTLQEVLDAREHRVQRQQELLRRFGKTLVCFTMNIAGPVKSTPLVGKGFHLGADRLRAQLTGAGMELLYQQEEILPAGCQGFYVVDADPTQVKALTKALEESCPVGRLFDMDVLAPDGTKLQRETERTCLICGQSARVCGRSRSHSVAQLQQVTDSLLREAVRQQESRDIGTLAARALLTEAAAATKPGLVDRLGSGSHKDMDLFTFLSSTAALQPYLTDCARVGMDTAEEEAFVTFERIRFLGRQAEQTMLKATGGVNTHKGAIFTMGLLCAAAGRLDSGFRCQPEKILAQCKAMCAGLTQRDLAGVTLETAKTAGQKLFAQYGITGARGQAEAGFPAVLHTGLPVLENGLEKGHTLEQSGCAALLAMLSVGDDTNLLARSDPNTANRARQKAAAVLESEGCPREKALQELDDWFVERNLSPGGTADLLAASYFLHFMKQ